MAPCSLFFVLLLAGCAAAYTFIHLFFHRGLSRITPARGQNAKKVSFSVIIAARNEERTIGRCLERILAQRYPKERFEVWVVNDRSTDGTAHQVQQWADKDQRVQLLNVEQCPPGVSPKKHAVALAASVARNEVLLFTDADSQVPEHWMETLSNQLDEETVFVSGLTLFAKIPGMTRIGFGLQQADFLSHAVVSAAAIGWGLPLNTNANNLAVRREAFVSVRGYAGLSGVVSGDDDLLLQALSKAGGRIRFAPERTAAVATDPAFSIREAWEQRKRWSSKTVYYNGKAVGLLSTVFLYYLLILCLVPLGLVWDTVLVWCALAAWTHKTALDALLFYRGTSKFQVREHRHWFWVLAPFHIPLIVGAVLFGVFGRFTWKDGPSRRKVSMSL